jgi:osmotically-inducible protein OsmY
MSTCTDVEREPAEALTHSPLAQLRRLAVVSDDSRVTITGTVNSYYLKQLAQETVLSLIGDRELHNDVEVCPDAR